MTMKQKYQAVAECLIHTYETDNDKTKHKFIVWSVKCIANNVFKYALKCISKENGSESFLNDVDLFLFTSDSTAEIDYSYSNKTKTLHLHPSDINIIF